METYLSHTHTVEPFVILIREMLQHNVLKSILTGKFQTDQLENTFGHYRQLSGGNYLVAIIWWQLSGDSFRCFAE